MQGPGNIQRSLVVKGYVPKPKSEILKIQSESIRYNLLHDKEELAMQLNFAPPNKSLEVL